MSTTKLSHLDIVLEKANAVGGYEEVPAYRTTDGRTFSTPAEAEKHGLELALSTCFDGLSDVDTEEFIEFLRSSDHRVLALIGRYVELCRS